MSIFKLVYYETTAITRLIEADSVDDAVEKGNAIECVNAGDHTAELLSISGVMEVLDHNDKKVYCAEECTCNDESWYGVGHTTSCPHYGMDEDTRNVICVYCDKRLPCGCPKGRK